MKTKFNFKSQPCTSREQSERLLSLGLKKETADMTWEFSHTKNGEPQYDCRAESSWDSETFASYVEHCEKIGYFEHWKHEDGSQMTPEEVYDEIMKIHIPAWSLHRLIELRYGTNWYQVAPKIHIERVYDDFIDAIEEELYFEPGGFSERCMERLPLRVDCIHRLEFGEVSGHRVLIKRGPGNRGPTECGTSHEATSGMSS